MSDPVGVAWAWGCWGPAERWAPSWRGRFRRRATTGRSDGPGIAGKVARCAMAAGAHDWTAAAEAHGCTYCPYHWPMAATARRSAAGGAGRLSMVGRFPPALNEEQQAELKRAVQGRRSARPGIDLIPGWKVVTRAGLLHRKERVRVPQSLCRSSCRLPASSPQWGLC